MRGVGWAFVLEFWVRSRLLLMGMLAYLVALLVFVHALPDQTFKPENVFPLTLPFLGTLLVIMAQLSHGETADVLARESGYPRRALTLPVRTASLALWPMAIGGLAVALGWLVLGGLVFRVRGAPVPVVWPAIFGAALVVWAQALTWSPFPLPALRIFVGVPILGGMVMGAALGQVFGVPELLLAAVFAGLIPAGYFVAVAGLARARRGDGMDGAWPALFSPGASPAARPPFARPAEALLWLDWRRTGWIMPLFVNICLIPELLLIYFIEPQHPIMVSVAAAVFLAMLVMVSLVMAFAVGTALGNMHPWAPGKYAMPPFCAARPVTSSELLIVKARLAVRLVAVSVLVVLLPIVAILPFTFAGRVLGGWARELIELYGLRGAGLLLTGAAALALLHVKAIVDHMFIGLAGRAWVPVAAGVVIMVCSVMVAILIGWIAANPDVQDVLLNAVPWAVALALALKVMAGALVGRILVRRELVTHRSLALFAAAWLVAAVWLVGLVVFVMPPELYSPWVVGCAAVVLLLPMVRLGLAPLALEWNRHR